MSEKIQPTTIAYGTPGPMFAGAVEAIHAYRQDAYNEPTEIAMSTATRKALFLEFFPKHEPNEWQEGDLVGNVPMVIDDTLKHGEFRVTGKHWSTLLAEAGPSGRPTFRINPDTREIERYPF